MRRPRLHVVLLVASLVVVAIPLTSSPASAATSVGFGKSSLTGASSEFPTSLQFGPAEVVVGAGNGSGEVRFRLEVEGQAMTTQALPLSLPGPDAVDLSFRVDPIHSTIRARYVVISGGAVGPTVPLGSPVTVPSSWLSDASLVVGLISSTHGADPFPATWDFLRARE